MPLLELALLSNGAIQTRGHHPFEPSAAEALAGCGECVQVDAVGIAPAPLRARRRISARASASAGSTRDKCGATSTLAPRLEAPRLLQPGGHVRAHDPARRRVSRDPAKWANGLTVRVI
jgi:hypothetical protein